MFWVSFDTNARSLSTLMRALNRVLAAHIQEAVFKAYAWSPGEGTKWWPRGTAILEPLAARYVSHEYE
jgi:hypothetical protein